MSEQATPKQTFIDSLERCKADESFIPSFYERFLECSDEIKFKFRLTNFEKQNEMLLHSLELSADATLGKPKALEEIHLRGVSHDREHLDIKPELYEFWLDSLIETAKRIDEQWDDDVEASWRSILGHVITVMVRMY